MGGQPRTTGSPTPSARPRHVERVIDQRRAARRLGLRRWLLVGLGLLLIAFGVFRLFSPVRTDPKAFCGDRAMIVVGFGSGSTTPSSLDPDDREWCRSNGRDQVVAHMMFLVLPGTLILGWQARRVTREWRAPEEPGLKDAGPKDAAPKDSRPEDAGIVRPLDALDPVHPSRKFPGRLVAASNYTWLVVEDRPDHSTLLVTGRNSALPFASREFEVAGDMSRRVTFRVPGADKKFGARPDRLDRLGHWWSARSQRPDRPGLAGDTHGPSTYPSTAAAAPPPPDSLRSAWAHAPARRRLRRSLRSAGLLLAIALLLAMVIVWAAATDQDWFWEEAEKGEGEGIAFADWFFLGSGLLILAGVVGIARFLRRWSILRRQPWRLADIVSPAIGQVVVREHSGGLGPFTFKVKRTLSLHATIRVLACKQLWFVVSGPGTLIAATPDFRTIVGLRLEPTETVLV